MILAFGLKRLAIESFKLLCTLLILIPRLFRSKSSILCSLHCHGILETKNMITYYQHNTIGASNSQHMPSNHLMGNWFETRTISSIWAAETTLETNIILTDNEGGNKYYDN